MASENIRTGETLMIVPPRNLINIRTIAATFDIDWRKPSVPSHALLAAFLLRVQKTDQEHQHFRYVRSLPKTFLGVPLTWAPSWADYLPESTKAYIRKQQHVYDSHLDAILELRTQNPSKYIDFSKEEYMWAWLCVNTRSIYQEISTSHGREHNMTMAPLVDMINHARTSESTFRHTVQGLEVVTQKAYRKGDEIFICYGAHGTEALICEYGFCLPRNREDTLSLDHHFDGLLSPFHVRLLQEIGYWEEYTIDYYGEPSFRTETVLRVCLLSEEDCTSSGDGYRRLTQFINGISDGRREQLEVDKLLRSVIQNEIRDASRMLDKIEKLSRSVEVACLLELWDSRYIIAKHAIDRLEN